VPRQLRGLKVLSVGRIRIKRFFGSSENAVKSQIWIAVSVYVLVANLLESYFRG
jgi:hypothetical protein